MECLVAIRPPLAAWKLGKPKNYSSVLAVSLNQPLRDIKLFDRSVLRSFRYQPRIFRHKTQAKQSMRNDQDSGWIIDLRYLYIFFLYQDLKHLWTHPLVLAFLINAVIYTLTLASRNHHPFSPTRVFNPSGNSPLATSSCAMAKISSPVFIDHYGSLPNTISDQSSKGECFEECEK